MTLSSNLLTCNNLGLVVCVHEINQLTVYSAVAVILYYSLQLFLRPDITVTVIILHYSILLYCVRTVFTSGTL